VSISSIRNRKRPLKITFLGIFLLISSFFAFSFKSEWGFYGHRKINRMAIFTLPSEMLPLYKKYVTYIEEHSVDPDKRRYATKFEAQRHYIDLDQWGVLPFNDLQKDFHEVLIEKSSFYLVDKKDTLILRLDISDSKRIKFISNDIVLIDTNRFSFIKFYNKEIANQYYEDEWSVKKETLQQYFPNLKGDLVIKDNFSEHGILPYHLDSHLRKLTLAFEKGDLNLILKHSAEIGHYIGDAHVPLHTTKNYNGQLTNQLGIHAFWESRIPELFADKEYDFYVGKAEFIVDPKSYFWKIVIDSHKSLEDVLQKEKKLSEKFPTDKQYCYDERLGTTARTQCKEYAEAYQNEMAGMVENRMADAVLSIGSVWMTAWINAGQPDLKSLIHGNIVMNDNSEELKEDPNVKTRDHEKE
jgi:hypothetical protein